MGQHKYNPIAMAAKEGKIPPRPQRMGKSQMRKLMKETMVEYVDRVIHENFRDLYAEMEEKRRSGKSSSY